MQLLFPAESQWTVTTFPFSYKIFFSSQLPQFGWLIWFVLYAPSLNHSLIEMRPASMPTCVINPDPFFDSCFWSLLSLAPICSVFNEWLQFCAFSSPSTQEHFFSPPFHTKSSFLVSYLSLYSFVFLEQCSGGFHRQDLGMLTVLRF